MAHRPTSPAVAVVAGLVALGALGINIARHYGVEDDAYITYRYVDRWIAGHGLTFNDGERVEGYTNFLWIVLLAPLRLVGVGPELASLLLSLLALGALLWAVYSTASRLGAGAHVGWSALTLAAGSIPLARWTGAGMETVCFAAILSLANERLSRHGRHTTSSAVGYGLAVLTRPPGVLHAAAAFGAAMPWRGPGRISRIRALLVPALVFAAFPVGHVVFRLAYYGLPLPNTYYAKLTGELPNLVPAGLDYVLEFSRSGGGVLIGACALLPFLGRRWNWIVGGLAAQVVLHLLYVIRAGGDYFAFARFVVPVIPALAVLGALGLNAGIARTRVRARSVVPLVALLLACVETGLGYTSASESAFHIASEAGRERVLVADWLGARLAPDATIAVNAAGVIPYRTGLRTIDMLGLTDAHIARSPVAARAEDAVFTGHFKHDGSYVCAQQPDAVVTSGGDLHPGRTAEEATFQAALNTFPGDREFLRAPACQGKYAPVAEELTPGRFVVVYFRRDAPPEEAREAESLSAEAWFKRGLTLMRGARLEEALAAFRLSLQMAPGNTAALTNMGFCLVDLRRFDEAVPAFERALANQPSQYDALYGLAMAHAGLGHREEAVRLWRRYVAEAPASPWTDRAKQQLQMLGAAPSP